VLDSLDAAAVRRWCGGGLVALRAHQHEIDELNVYPVPDGDTGTNLVLTLTSAQQALDEDPDPDFVDPGFPGSGSGGSGSGGGPVVTGEIVQAAPGEAAATPLGRAMRRMARGALLGARGNSGVIVSQILRGMADTFATAAAVRGGELARALRTASEAAYKAVAKPVEGTVLSVVAAAADGAGKIASDDLVVVAKAAARSAAEALARTPQQLPILARAGVVDAGGRGLVLLLEALVEALGSDVTTTQPPATPAAATDAAVPAAATRPAVPEAATGAAALGEDDGAFGYEVQYLLDAAPEAVETLQAALSALGDSLVVVGTGEGQLPTWNVHVHVHVDDVGTAIEAGIVAGRPHRISVTRLEDRLHAHGDRPRGDGPSGNGPCEVRLRGDGPSEDGPRGDGLRGDGLRGDELRGDGLHGDMGGHDRRHAAAEAAPREAVPGGVPDRGPGAGIDPDARGAVVVAAGDGLTAIFAAEGAVVVGRNPSTAEFLAAIAATRAGQVVLLPNDANTHAVASSAAREAASEGIRVSVVPTRSPVQALAALAVRDPQRAFDDDVIAMAEAAGACRYGEVCTASREALTVAGRCRPGDLLGLVDGEVHVIGADLDEVCRRLLDRMLGGGGELTTLVLGAAAPAELEDNLRGHVTQAWPFVELQCYAGGQPRYHLLVGVE
jgi:dihydroxyacetone kinase-like predicted kinase